ncbi:MAG: hypothetical protein PHN82_05490 [bacterium]|nr:hypothetical protein [bacterium]
MVLPPVAACAFVLAPAAGARGQGQDDLVFIHHSCGQNWLADGDGGLEAALLAKPSIDERNDISYRTDLAPDAGRPDSLDPVPGDSTNMDHWIRWFNDYLGRVRQHGCATGSNRIIMFKSCYPISNVTGDGSEPGDPFSSSQTLANYKAVFRHPSGPGNTYSSGDHSYKPLGDIFAEHPGVLFIVVTAPPRHYAPWDATTDAEAARARSFNDWLKTEWLDAYQAAHGGLNNVAVYDWFDFLAYPGDHATRPNRLRWEYGGASGDSHPSTAANQASTEDFATGDGNFLDAAFLRWERGTDRINFQPAAAAVPGAFVFDDGSAYGRRCAYGWR